MRKILIFGPVKSRRLGRSLGIEMVPKKVCTMDCIYCEVGKTKIQTLTRKAYYPWDLIEESILEAKKRESISDVITFTGSGEPTLNVYFEKAVEFSKKIITKPIAVLTNSTLLYIDSIRKVLSMVDIVLPSLDAVKEESFRKINRPLPEIKPVEIVKNLKKLRQEMKGEMWLEIFIVEGINDNKEDLKALKEAIEEIKPHRVQLNTSVRPTAYSIAKPVSFEKLQDIAEFLGKNVEIIVNKEKLAKIISRFLEREKLEEEVINYIKRRPATIEELSQAFNLDEKVFQRLLEELLSQERIKLVIHDNRTYYVAN